MRVYVPYYSYVHISTPRTHPHLPQIEHLFTPPHLLPVGTRSVLSNTCSRVSTHYRLIVVHVCQIRDRRLRLVAQYPPITYTVYIHHTNTGTGPVSGNSGPVSTCISEREAHLRTGSPDVPAQALRPALESAVPEPLHRSSAHRALHF